MHALLLLDANSYFAKRKLVVLKMLSGSFIIVTFNYYIKFPPLLLVRVAKLVKV